MSVYPRFLLALLLVLTCGCEYDEVEHEIGYKGRARVNPWLAAERFAERYDFQVESLASWRPPGGGDAVWFVPAEILNNESFVRRVRSWAEEGGHLVVMVEHAAAQTNDWRTFDPEMMIESPLSEMLEGVGIDLGKGKSGGGGVDDGGGVLFDGKTYQVDADSSVTVTADDLEPSVFASVVAGRGRISVVADARIFRNRWIDQEQHAEFLLALMEAGNREGTVVFVSGSGLSFYGLMRRYLWTVLLGLAVLLVLWLWKNLSRFGPLEADDAPAVMRGYVHHLEALGNFHWRLDRAAALLGRLREQVVERAQQSGARGGRLDAGVVQLLADRSGIPHERVCRALATVPPADSASLVRVSADLQILIKSLH